MRSRYLPGSAILFIEDKSELFVDTMAVVLARNLLCPIPQYVCCPENRDWRHIWGS